MELDLINKLKDYYSRALSLIQKNDYEGATKVLYKEMSMDLYDSSMDILFNRNLESVDANFEELKQLIKLVDDKLSKYSFKEDELPEAEDRFIGDIF